MRIVVSVVEHSRVPIEVREIFSFATRRSIDNLNNAISSIPSVSGCVLISTCNRTELYISSECPINPSEELCRAIGIDYSLHFNAFESFGGFKAVHHLMEVAAGLRSRVFGEDQIISQVREAISLARDVEAADSVLETLFRLAITAGKEIRSTVRLTAVSSSAAEGAVKLLEEKSGGLAGKKVLVIGNGEMGRTAAGLLRQKGCKVTVTLRSYRHGETVIPTGCKAVPYNKRFLFINEFDILISATASPHYTITLPDVEEIERLPEYMVDLALPRDIQPQIGELTSLYNVDDLGFDVKQKIPKIVYDIIGDHETRFYKWINYRDSLTAARKVKG